MNWGFNTSIRKSTSRSNNDRNRRNFGLQNSAILEGAMNAATIEDMVRSHARLHAQYPCVTFDEVTLTYQDMDRRSNAVANGLLAEGCVAGDRIGVVDKNGFPIFETLFGARKMGVVQVAVNWRLAAPEMAYILGDSDVKILFVQTEFFAHLAKIKDQLPSVRKIIAIGDHPDYENYKDWIARQKAEDTGYSSGPEDTCLQLYTSGTTGRPKGTLLCNRNILSFIEAATQTFGVFESSAHLNCLPLFHVGGMVWSLFCMSQGGHCVGTREFDAAKLIEYFAKYKITHGMTVPAVIQMLLAVPAARTTDFSNLRGITYGGSPISEKVLIDALQTFKCGMYGMYGATEVSFGLTILTPEEHDPVNRPELLKSVGKALKGTEMKIVDPISLEEVVGETVGEVWIRSPSVSIGYWKKEQETATVFRADGWFRSGDLGYYKNGFLYLHDRLKDMIVTGAENVYPAEVERVILQHPDVTQAAVIGIPDDVWGEAVKAIIVPVSDATATEGEIKAFCRERLAGYKCPKTIEFVDALPMTPSGKIIKHELRKTYWENRARQIN
ncbi:MAG: long-chain-fatty-acid--CoA ligase [Alphaproteobacteria bacterium]|nr:long-chain-fatty-acid--CoA ligase [Alphaproteobacteria bacterium]